MRRFALLLTTVLAGCAVVEQPSATRTGFCPSLNPGHVCEVPIEALLADRGGPWTETLATTGVVVADNKFGPRSFKALLFPSAERARVCSPAGAIELVVTDRQLIDSIVDMSYSQVRVVGTPRASENGHWLAFDLAKAPVRLGDELEGARGCITSPPNYTEPPPVIKRQ